MLSSALQEMACKFGTYLAFFFLLASLAVIITISVIQGHKRVFESRLKVKTTTTFLILLCSNSCIDSVKHLLNDSNVNVLPRIDPDIKTIMTSRRWQIRLGLYSLFRSQAKLQWMGAVSVDGIIKTRVVCIHGRLELGKHLLRVGHIQKEGRRDTWLVDWIQLWVTGLIHDFLLIKRWLTFNNSVKWKPITFSQHTRSI